MYYLTNDTTLSYPVNSYGGNSPANRPIIDGAILQAPVSDREELHMNLQRRPDPANAWETYHKLSQDSQKSKIDRSRPYRHDYQNGLPTRHSIQQLPLPQHSQ
jgi:Protein of unknown function (DUF1749).